MNNPFESADWTESSLSDMWEIIRKVAKEEFKLDFYEPYFEVVTFEEMLQIYTTGFPIMFHHWTFGKQFEDLYKQYKHNRASIAYEVIFNTDPALCYLLETNTSTMQGLVMAHAACGHSAFNKRNEFILSNTNAKTILTFLKNFRDFTQECEAKYGSDRVEEVLDVCECLQLYAIDRAEIVELNKAARDKKKENRKTEQEKDFDIKVAQLLDKEEENIEPTPTRLCEENILKFIGKNSPSLKQWERELINMFCTLQQYFYPQRLTKTMNEGYASFWHYTLMNRLYDLGYLEEGNVLEFLQSHTAVLCQHDHDSPYYHGLNPYKLGYEIYNDIKRICTEPTEEDRQLFPDLIGKNWIDEVHFAAQNFKDESFILQYLSPKVVRDFKLFKYTDDSEEFHYTIDAVHSDEDFREIRRQLSLKLNFSNNLPYIYIEGADLRKSRALYMVCKEVQDAQVKSPDFEKTLLMIKKLWNFPVKIKYYQYNGDMIKAEV